MIGKRIYSGSPFEEMAGYARAVVDGEMIYVSGTTGFNVETLSFAPDVESQCEQCFANIEATLKQADSGLDCMLRVCVFVTTREEFERIKPIIKKHCDASRPANTTILCELATEEMRVEVEVTAKKRPAGQFDNQGGNQA